MRLHQVLQLLAACAVSTKAAFTWQNVHIGGGGGFTPGIVFHPTEKGVAYARTDIGGLYRLNSDDSWTAVTDSLADNEHWNRWGVDAVALDPQNPNKVYAAVGMYTNSWFVTTRPLLVSLQCSPSSGIQAMALSFALLTRARHGR